MASRQRKAKYEVHAGRQIYRDGEPFISIGRAGGPGQQWSPTVVDEVTRFIAECLSRSTWTPYTTTKY